MTTQQAATELELTDARIRQLILDGSLPAFKMGRDWVIRRADLKKVRSRQKPGRPKGSGKKTDEEK